MIRIEFSQEDIDQLHYERFHHPHPHVQLKMESLYLKALGYSHQEICRLVRLSNKTLRSYLQTYKKGGIEALKRLNFHAPSSELDKHKQTLAEEFEKNPPATIKEAAKRIEAMTGIRRSIPQVRAFLQRLGLKRRKVGQVPSKGDPDVQKAFLEEELKPRLEEAKTGKRELFFVDAAHFVLAPFLGFLWCFARYFLKAPCGRQRFNVLGALHATSKKVVTITNDTYINAHSVVALLHKIALTYPQRLITLVLDNARYQRCRLVMDTATKLGIELLFLPPYSPNLNLIERLWKFVKKVCLTSKYFEKFTDFKEAIISCLDEATGKHKQALDSLLSLNFQIIENVTLCP